MLLVGWTSSLRCSHGIKLYVGHFLDSFKKYIFYEPTIKGYFYIRSVSGAFDFKGIDQ